MTSSSSSQASARHSPLGHDPEKQSLEKQASVDIDADDKFTVSMGRVVASSSCDSGDGPFQTVSSSAVIFAGSDNDRIRDGAADASGDATGPTFAGGQYRTYRRRWFGLVELALLNAIGSWNWLTFAPVADNAAMYFGKSETVVNWLSIASLFAFTFITPVVIYVLYLGPKHSMVTAASLFLVGNWVRFAGAYLSSGGRFGVVMLGQILTGLGQAFVLTAPARYSDLWFTHRGRVAATAVMSLANPLGAALGQLIVPFWVNKPGDVSRMVLYVAIISSVCSVPAFFLPKAPPTPVAPSAETPKLSLRQSAHALFSHIEFYLLFIPFSVYVGLFNSVSSLLNQIMLPHGFSDDEAGIAGAILIVVGLVSAAVTSPIIDRNKSYLLAIRIAVPIIAACYLAFVWMPETGHVAGPYVIMGLLGASSFSLVPIVVEFLVEVTHPVSPAVTGSLAWSGGQVLGAIFIIISGGPLKAGPDADPPQHMKNALIFTAVFALAAMPFALSLGLFGRKDKLTLRRVRSDQGVDTQGDEEKR
ncbi:uncharacterized protein CTHT_0040780 [Thermochaetoides thermophila DSM 1495]|uniref:Major facilitator superfamily (MFS) profile domain-containing protein n=1 Tax=Chaetomium thermophilum (strain DSM 1495 / CBS 144.50 / IMI 039719) TaxID=759272 RepID=G0SA27_CHATD|nr:hypothetical protein CTHT_0040780 [Thermochaetoides thermophila DSM 1495]EGS19599.1 hypothetical protein CTHT_0040780 [Thermochaetoides thermophila DSM 1495]